jgi:penicillin-binding protein 1A
MRIKYAWVWITAAVFTGVVTGWVVSRVASLPNIEALEAYRPGEVSRIFSDDGTLIEELFIEKREVVPFERIPRHLKEALLAVEDSRFYRHHGIDFRGIARAALKNLMAGRIVQGGSTITQQLSKVLFFTPERTLSRKVKEAILTLQIEKRYTKEQILNLYLNQIYLGTGCYGVQTVSRRYFGKDVSDLTLAEAALIAALPKSPGKYSPLANPEEARQRRDHVLERMVAEAFISPDAARAARNEPLRLQDYQELNEEAPHFVQAVVRELTSRLGRETLFQGGLSIHTTLNLRLQRNARTAVQAGLEASAARQPAQAETPAEGALFALDPRNGHVKAMVGGRDYAISQFNRAVQAVRQPGSAFKPIIYAAALEQGRRPSDILMDTPMTYRDPHTKKTWTPQNFTHKFSGAVTLRRALENSLNVPTVRLLQEVGVKNSMEMAQRLGVRSSIRPYLSLALGTSEVTLAELTAAYAAFAAQGVYSKPMLILQVYDHNGRLIENHEPDQQIALDEATAFLITYLLQGVVQSGTGQIARSLNRPVAAKTGTTDNYSDAWFVGYTPDLAAGVWVGHDERVSLGKGETGARAAGPIWVSFMSEALKNRAPAYFAVPPAIFFKRINALTGETAGLDSEEVIEEAFRK